MKPAQRESLIAQAFGEQAERPHWEYEPTEQQVAELIQRFGGEKALPSAADLDVVMTEKQMQEATAGKQN
ncbi:MAG TPA: hypothetical protein VGT24_13210 [Candidatus Acidoferrales bacterium]|nr:hypothetical protein [Candidatus Acidoferrales bacterium]